MDQANPSLRSLAIAPRPLLRRSLSEEVYRILRSMIVQRQLEPGSKVVEGRIAAMLGVSRTPVREAFQRLEYDGWLVTRHGHSVRVAPMTLSKIREIYPLIATLEGLAVRLAIPHLTEEDLDLMEEMTTQMKRHYDEGNIDVLLACDGKFHGVIHERSQNRRLQLLIAELRAQMERLEYAFFSDNGAVGASLRRHRRLIEVLRQRDPRAAQQHLERQWALGQRELERIVERMGLIESAAPPIEITSGRTPAADRRDRGKKPRRVRGARPRRKKRK